MPSRRSPSTALHTLPTRSAPLPVADWNPERGRAGANDADLSVMTEARAVVLCTLHDLRTPLGTISGWVEVLERHLDAGDPLVRQALSGMRRGVERQQQTLTDVEVSVRQQTTGERSGKWQSLGDLLRQQARLTGAGGRLEAFDELHGLPSLSCPHPAGSLGDAVDLLLGVILKAASEEPLHVTATSEHLRVELRTVEPGDGPLRALCSGDYSLRTTRLGDCSAARLWAARVAFRQAGIALRCEAGEGRRLAVVLSSGPVDTSTAEDGVHEHGTGVGRWPV